MKENPMKFLNRMMLIAAMALPSSLSLQAETKNTNTTFAKEALTPFVQSGQLPGAICVFYKDGI